jgi:predicted nucleic acid-binding protein
VQPTSPTCVVITDTSLLINLTHTGHLPLLCQTPPYRFVVPDEVVNEVTDETQRQALEGALDAGVLARVTIETTQELELYGEFLQILGTGESACLALASARGWIVACDEKRVFLREARKHLGEGRLLNTVGLYVTWVRSRLLIVAEADEAKRALEARRFRMSFETFADIV